MFYGRWSYENFRICFYCQGKIKSFKNYVICKIIVISDYYITYRKNRYCSDGRAYSKNLFEQ